MKYSVQIAFLGLVLMQGFSTGIARASDVRNERDVRLECKFESDLKGLSDCRIRLQVCREPLAESDRDQCRKNRLVLVCERSTRYDDNFLTGRVGDHLLVQGITSLENPTPPSLLISVKDHHDDHARLHAILTTSEGRLFGHCRADDDIRGDYP